jgi:non-heme chloroperoxidase
MVPRFTIKIGEPAGRSTQTANGHDMDTYAADVAELVKALDLKNAVHIDTRPAAVRLRAMSHDMVKGVWQRQYLSAPFPRPS